MAWKKASLFTPIGTFLCIWIWKYMQFEKYVLHHLELSSTQILKHKNKLILWSQFHLCKHIYVYKYIVFNKNRAIRWATKRRKQRVDSKLQCTYILSSRCCVLMFIRSDIFLPDSKFILIIITGACKFIQIYVRSYSIHVSLKLLVLLFPVQESSPLIQGVTLLLFLLSVQGILIFATFRPSPSLRQGWHPLAKIKSKQEKCCDFTLLPSSVV